MADQKISELTNITGANLANADEFVVVDISADQTKAVTRAEFFKDTPSIDVNGTVTADGLTVDGNVGIGTTSPSRKAHVASTNAYLNLQDTNGTQGGSMSSAVLLSDSADATAGAMGFFGTSSGTMVLRNLSGNLNLDADLNNLSVDSKMTFGVDGTTSMTIDSSGNVLVGTTVASGNKTHIAFDNSAENGMRFSHTSGTYTKPSIAFVSVGGAQVGSIKSTASATSYITSSDYRLKENITPVQNAGDIVKAMQPVTYTFKSDGSWHDGFLAHELQELHPRAVTGSKDAMKDEEYEVTPAVEATYDAEGVELTPAVPAVMGTRSVPDYQGVDYSKLTPILTAALQEALNKIDALETRLTTLEG